MGVNGITCYDTNKCYSNMFTRTQMMSGIGEVAGGIAGTAITGASNKASGGTFWKAADPKFDPITGKKLDELS